jgi:hypothetical protein
MDMGKDLKGCMVEIEFARVHCRSCYASGPRADDYNMAWKLWKNMHKKEIE